MRLFEATGLACTLITDHKSDLHEYFEINREILSYKNKNELLEILNHISEYHLNEIGRNAQCHVLNNYSTKKKIRVLSEIFIHL